MPQLRIHIAAAKTQHSHINTYFLEKLYWFPREGSSCSRSQQLHAIQENSCHCSGNPHGVGMQGPTTSQACHHYHLKSSQICLLEYPRPQEIFLPALSSFNNIISQMKAWMGQCSRSVATFIPRNINSSKSIFQSFKKANDTIKMLLNKTALFWHILSCFFFYSLYAILMHILKLIEN